MTDQTPNLGLERIPADQKIWADKMNNNLSLIDAVVGAYFFLNNLQGVWLNSHEYLVGQAVVDPDTGTVWTCQYQHISAMIPTTFLEERTANPTFWTVYSAPARARGAWTGPGTTYGVNDFVVAGPKYAVCIQAHVSTANFDNDVTSGYWSVLVDLSAAGSQVLPVPRGAADANKIVVVPSNGNGYTIVGGDALLAILGVSSIGEAVFKAASQGDARAAINAQIAGSYQGADATLTALTGKPTTAFGIALLALAAASDLRATAGLGTAATLNVGTGGSQIVQLDGSAKLPAVDGSQLTNLVHPYPTLTTYEAVLVANVPLNNISVYQNGPNLGALPAGKYLVQGTIIVQDAAGAANIHARLRDDSTVHRSSLAYCAAAGAAEQIAFSKVITNPGANLRIDAVDVTATSGNILSNPTGQGNNASYLIAIKIG